MVLNLLGFVRIGFVGKLTKWMNGYNKQGHWSNVDGEERLIFKFSIRQIDMPQAFKVLIVQKLVPCCNWGVILTSY
jgi:hypothetical protein